MKNSIWSRILYPSAPSERGVLNPAKGSLFIVVPISRTNEVTNPSFETNTTSYTASGGSIARSTTQSYHGAYSLAITPTSALTDGAFYGTISTTAGEVRAISCKWYGVPGVKYKLSVATTGGVDLAVYRFVGAGRWQWVWVYWKETSSTTRRIYFTKDSHNSTAVFYVDGVQSEVIVAGETVSTYIDGDQSGLLIDQSPRPYRWNGTPHASTSIRDITTAAGGYVVNLDRLRFKLISFVGLGIPLISNIAFSGGAADGSTFQGEVVQSRPFVVHGRFEADSSRHLKQLRSDLYSIVGPDAASPRQPLTLLYQPLDGADEIGEQGRIVASYQDGLGQVDVGLPVEEANITFTQYLPFIFGGERGTALTVQQSLSSSGGILYRSPAGTWSKLGTGMNGGVNAIVRVSNGDIYVGGSFTDAGGSGADNLAKYTPSTGTWSVVKSATSIGNTVTALAVGPDDSVYIGGTFTNADGIANADFIVKYTPSTNTYSALSTGMNNTVNALAVGLDGKLYASGNFTTAGGVACNGTAFWDGAAWNAMGSGGGNNNSIAVGKDGKVYFGGTQTNMGGVAAADYIGYWDGSAWNAMGTGMDSDVNVVGVGIDGKIYAGGFFTTADGLTANGLAEWNGSAWSALGTGYTSPGSFSAYAISTQTSGGLIIGGDFTLTDYSFASGLVGWNGVAYVPFDVTGATINAIYEAPDGGLYIGGSISSVTTNAITSVTNNGTARSFPGVVINGPSSGSSRIYLFVNKTTGKSIYFDLSINAGEVITIRTSASGTTVTSSFRNDITNTIIRGSSPDLSLRVGPNNISFFAANSTVTALLTYQTSFQSTDDLVD